jgi:hypothetical protein
MRQKLVLGQLVVVKFIEVLMFSSQLDHLEQIGKVKLIQRDLGGSCLCRHCVITLPLLLQASSFLFYDNPRMFIESKETEVFLLKL